jgi:acetaldehyde dehydrogenase
MNGKLRAAIIGPGNIGIDLMMKIFHSRNIELKLMAGIIADTPGMKLAEEKGVAVTADGIDGLLTFHAAQRIDIAFDATGARSHLAHASKLKQAGIFAIDLTPAAVGPYVVPAVGMDRELLAEANVNMVTCGGQATVPIVFAINRVVPVQYARSSRPSAAAAPVQVPARTLTNSPRPPATPLSKWAVPRTAKPSSS